jgi:AraC-like DNA-binding protein
MGATKRHTGLQATDTLSLLLSRFAISAGVFYTGSICGVHAFEADRLHGHLHLIEQGPVDLIDADGGCLHIARPSIVFLPRSDHHRLVADDRKGARVICGTVQFGGGSSNPICDSLPSLVLVQLADLEGTGLLLKLIGQEAFRETPGGQAAVDRLCEVLIIRLLRHCLSHGMISRGTLAGLSDSRLAKALVEIHRQPARSWDLVNMAAAAGMSRARFAAHFREVTGQTPADYLAGCRITVAQNLLMSGRAMKQVSAEAGYGSSSAFSRAFMRKVGLPPSEWLKNLETAQTDERALDTAGEGVE